MINGFFEFGLVALIAFAFVNPLAILAFTGADVPRTEEKTRKSRKLEQGIPVEGAKLVTPEIRIQVPVA